MKILNRKEFLALEGEHVFAKYEPCCTGELSLFVSGSYDDDFNAQSLSPDSTIESRSGDEMCYLMDKMEKDSSIDTPMDYHCYGRDGLFDKDQMFAVLSGKDVSDLIERLIEVRESQIQQEMVERLKSAGEIGSEAGVRLRRYMFDSGW